MKPTYDISKSFEWNYDHGPVFAGDMPPRKMPEKKVKILDFELNSKIGVPAGPLLNSNWVKFYAQMGFDIPVYKTVRTVKYQVHPHPNCVYVKIKGQIKKEDIGGNIEGSSEKYPNISEPTITNSFGMPSDPDKWQDDIGLANSYLSEGQIMVVSVVGTPGESDLAEDYAKCAKMAKEAGAKIIEANYSCPNVASGEGSIYVDPEFSSQISKKIKKAIGDTPLFIKVGYFEDKRVLEEVVKKNAPFVQGVSGINTISMAVRDQDGNQALPGKGRLTSGLCGHAIRDLSREFIRDLNKIRDSEKYDFVICGVGGITQKEDFAGHFNAGCDIAMAATGAMWNPFLAKELGT